MTTIQNTEVASGLGSIISVPLSLQNPLVFLAVSVATVATVAAVPSGGIVYSSPLTYGTPAVTLPAAVTPTKTGLATVNTVSE